MTLDQIALKHGTDKSSNWHNYTEIYARYFDHKRNEIKNVLEIGVFRGSSVKMWQEYLPNAQIYGVDIDPNCKQYEGDRIKIIIADATKNFELSVKKFDLIVDDGSHKNCDILNSFYLLFDSVAHGGYYIIEDTNTSYWGEFYSEDCFSTMDYFKKVVDYIHFMGLKGENYRCEKKYIIEFAKAHGYKVNWMSKEVKSIHFYNGLIFIEKA